MIKKKWVKHKTGNKFYSTRAIVRKPGQGAGRAMGSTTIPPLPVVPVVITSTIEDYAPNGILVEFDRFMTMTCDVKDQINIIINGAAPIHPETVDVSPNEPALFGFILPAGQTFKKGDVVTWAYDDQGPCELIDYNPPKAEADNQTYGVINKVPPAKPLVVSSIISDSNPNRILVEWSEDLKAEVNAHFALDIVIDGSAPIVPTVATITGKFMAMALTTAITAGQVITWSYKKNNPDEKISSIGTGLEPDGSSHTTTNNVK